MSGRRNNIGRGKKELNSLLMGATRRLKQMTKHHKIHTKERRTERQSKGQIILKKLFPYVKEFEFCLKICKNY